MLINLRNALMAGKKWKNPYNTDGLVAMWDGEWNTGPGVHDASATTWKNLAGNGFDLDVINGATFGSDHIICNQTNKPVASSDVGTTLAPVYVEFVYSKTQSNAYAFAFHTDQNIGIIAFKNSGVVFFSGYYPDCSIELGSSTSRGSIGFDYVDHNKYRNGAQVSAGNIYESWDSVSNRIAVGGRFNNSSSIFKGLIYCIRLYSVRPTEREIAANYAVDKARFGLP